VEKESDPPSSDTRDLHEDGLEWLATLILLGVQQVRRGVASPVPSVHPQLPGQIRNRRPGNLIVAPQRADLLVRARAE
jgi:hypothetical protein